MEKEEREKEGGGGGGGGEEAPFTIYRRQEDIGSKRPLASNFFRLGNIKLNTNVLIR